MGQVLKLIPGRQRRRGPLAEADVADLTKSEIAECFRVTERTINRWMDRGMPYDKPFEGGSVRFSEQECRAWTRRHR